jgi:predicted transcriptional regulator
MPANLIELTAEIVASYVESNTVGAADLPGLIQTVYQALGGAGKTEPEPEARTKLTPAQIRKLITPDAITSLEDGRTYKSMKRHLSLRGLTPAAYRTKWGLPDNFPMVAPSYSAARSALAKSAGLGAKGRQVPPAPEAAKSGKAAPKPRRKTTTKAG